MYQIISRGANKYCTAKRTSEETPVQPVSVLMTPQQALDMTNEGIPVSAQGANPDLFYDGDEHSDFIPLDRRRGVDIAETSMNIIDFIIYVSNVYSSSSI